MASTQFCIIFISVIAIFAPSVSANEFVVGDAKGWTLGVDYQAWAAGKEFMVGDTLVFNYPKGAHNVFKVNGTSFQDCAIPPASDALATGNDVITLGTPGRKWYICGVGKHCGVGNMKLFINVLSQAPAPSPSCDTPICTSAAPSGIGASRFYGLVSALFGILFLAIRSRFRTLANSLLANCQGKALANGSLTQPPVGAPGLPFIAKFQRLFNAKVLISPFKMKGHSK